MIFQNPQRTHISVGAPIRERIQAIFAIFEEHAKSSYLAEEGQESASKGSPSIFVGHGSSGQWRELKDHLQDKHGYCVEAYETGARTGHAVRDILEQMMSKSTFAILIFTCDDVVGDGKYRARQNVVHETGLFQGKLGFSRAIALIEDGVEGFSNIEGIQHIKFSRGNIKEVFGEVLATIRREFKAEMTD